MKNVVAYIFLLLEAIGIIAASVIYANKADALSAIYIQVPEGMQLTFEKETEVNTRDGVLLIPEGTVISSSSSVHAISTSTAPRPANATTC